MDGHIFTTLGWLPADRVELRETVTHDDEHVRLVRVDKYVDGVWVGNDINGQIKTGHEVVLETPQFA
ncbi:MAG TPA: hypothetical protein PLU79_10780 [Burkholderiaceae bacterium]|nr:hypothetical protein [Burkholderiaceae bacterium]HNB43611.1 hypothetical protein [Burkholderiaceae bacterium]